jgi:hypothetical protein
MGDVILPSANMRNATARHTRPRPKNRGISGSRPSNAVKHGRAPSDMVAGRHRKPVLEKKSSCHHKM